MSELIILVLLSVIITQFYMHSRLAQRYAVLWNNYQVVRDEMLSCQNELAKLLKED